MIQQNKNIDWSNFNPKLFSKINVLDKEFCLEIRNFAENDCVFEKHISNGKVWPVSYSTTSIPMSETINKKLHNLLIPIWEEAINYYNFEVSYTEPYEVKKYSMLDYVGDHMDQYFGTADIERKLSMVIQLSDKDEYQGGDLKLLRRFDTEKSIGSVIIFPSYYLHEVTRVTKGIRYSINSWAWGPFWK